MDILTHTLSGIGIGTVAASFSKQSTAHKTIIILLGGLGGVLPDIDAISLWSGFDASIGKFFNLEHSGQYIYSAKFWYSHHAFMHSLLASFIFSLLIASGLYLTQSRFKGLGFSGFLKSISKNKHLLLAFVFGFIIHLIEDMPTPSIHWGGINFLFPLDNYWGGTGQIWWWNNYDIFLIVVFVVLINLLVLISRKYLRNLSRKIPLNLFIAGVILILFQINSRNYNFSYQNSATEYHEKETQSKAIQKRILGDKLYGFMEELDQKIPFYF